MVSVMDRLNSEQWAEIGGHLTEEPPEGYQRYSINRRKAGGQVEFQYAAMNDEGKPFMLSLAGVKGGKDPLERIANVLFKVGEGNIITGIVVEDTIFEKK